MENSKRFKSFYDDCEDAFYEHLDNVKIYLKKSNKEYITIENNIKKILDENNILQRIFEGQYPNNSLNLTETTLICEIITLISEKKNIEEKELYFKGGMDAYYYFLKIGIIH